MAIYTVVVNGKEIQKIEADHFFQREGSYAFRREGALVYSVAISPGMSVAMLEDESELGDSWPRPR